MKFKASPTAQSASDDASPTCPGDGTSGAGCGMNGVPTRALGEMAHGRVLSGDHESTHPAHSTINGEDAAGKAAPSHQLAG